MIHHPHHVSRSSVATLITGQVGQFWRAYLGHFSKAPKRGDYKFQWDPIFIPGGQDKTYAELGFPDKGKYSQAAEAWRQLLKHLKGPR
jgi:inosine/xanthosine triphosphate pyrophosphatase family protein